MHETILKTMTVAIVSGLAVYWLTSRNHGNIVAKSVNPTQYHPLLGDVRTVQGTPSDVCCEVCGGLTTKGDTYAQLAADYLPCGSARICIPEHAPATSEWNLGVSIQLQCNGIDANVYREETATAFPHGVTGPNTAARPVIIRTPLVCAPNVCAQVCCAEVV